MRGPYKHSYGSPDQPDVFYIEQDSFIPTAMSDDPSTRVLLPHSRWETVLRLTRLI